MVTKNFLELPSVENDEVGWDMHFNEAEVGVRMIVVRPQTVFMCSLILLDSRCAVLFKENKVIAKCGLVVELDNICQLYSSRKAGLRTCSGFALCWPDLT